MQTDTYQQRRLEAALIAGGIATSWRQYLAAARRHKEPASVVCAFVHELGVTIDQRTLARWSRQAVIELAHASGDMEYYTDPRAPRERRRT